MPGKWIRIEKSVSGTPWISGGLHTNISRHGIHQYVSNCPFKRFVVIPHFTIIDVVAPEEFANTILPLKISGIQYRKAATAT